ncbi:sensor histidine kinase [Winogradskyella bathintestinalis]|uniref:histidine kinase n=1 Tax=Winogradskyella bathintestinalis TaxID=3035208 RepID=A0ABT7ZS73_9FLAO|nr:HAMP domain-containing sensor histidine kinase [Winogradskyella bathintestinalis]MDN3491838.1 HAMP domain-containing sensor histidine kinase [Winogradskyella bathintestinalis]
MVFSLNRNVIRWIIVISSFIIISLILGNTYTFFQNFKAEERNKMKTWSLAQKELSKTQDLNTDIELPLAILSSNTTTPMINVYSDGSLNPRNINEVKAKDSLYLLKLIKQFKEENDPIEISYKGKVFSTVYYGNSPLLNKLKYYPLALLLIILLFGAVVYFFYRSSKIAEQNKLWTGMAKETAHQIGTPLSSLVGWAEILKTENINPDYIFEIEKDIDRLQTITERFSKIGSAPTLKIMDIVAVTKSSYEYLRSRSSKLINFEIVIPENEILVNLNEQLFSWTIENLVKNAIDAMKGKGDLRLELIQLESQVFIQISDTGKGISKSSFTKIFEPGYTTKKRGWGLGLSLAKRIIEDYHNGKIKVLNSEIGKGTTIQIMLKTV